MYFDLGQLAAHSILAISSERYHLIGSATTVVAEIMRYGA
jgi:hypothetical protein